MTTIRKALVAGRPLVQQAVDAQPTLAQRISPLLKNVPTVQQLGELGGHCSDSWWMRRDGFFSLADIAAA